jgi:hypothetical protein
VSVLVVKATWGPTPWTDDEVQSAFDVAARFLGAASFGQVQLTATQTPWLTAYPGEVACPSPTNSQLVDEANTAAAAAGYDIAAYDRVAYLVPPVSGLCSDTATGNPLTERVVLIGALWAGLAAHELGHTFGMSHAGTLACATPHNACTRDPYGSPWDLMGSGGNTTSNPTGDPGALQKACAGWLTTYSYVTVPGTYTLDALELPSTLPQALIVRVAGRELWIDHREAIGNDAYLKTSIWHTLTSGITVHDAPVNAAQTPFFLRRPDYLLPNGGHGSWIAGSAPFRIPNVLEIDVLSHAGTTVRLRLRWLDHNRPSHRY